MKELLAEFLKVKVVFPYEWNEYRGQRPCLGRSVLEWRESVERDKEQEVRQRKECRRAQR